MSNARATTRTGTSGWSRMDCSSTTRPSNSGVSWLTITRETDSVSREFKPSPGEAHMKALYPLRSEPDGLLEHHSAFEFRSVLADDHQRDRFGLKGIQALARGSTHEGLVPPQIGAGWTARAPLGLRIQECLG